MTILNCVFHDSKFTIDFKKENLATCRLGHYLAASVEISSYENAKSLEVTNS